MDEFMPGPAPATWLWDTRVTAPDVVAFARAERVREVFATVPWNGPTAAIRALARALRTAGVRVACLGSGSDWADVPQNAAAWAGRALAGGDFDGVHLDVEPWAAEDWPADAERRLTGLALAVEAVRATTVLPAEIDVPAAVVAQYPEPFARAMTAASAVTIMSYRDRGPAIMALSAAAREVAASVGRSYRIGVETRRSEQAHTTFAEDGRRVMGHELAHVASALRTDPRFAGFAVHDLSGWRDLTP